MRKLIYFASALFLIVSASSCSKQCIQCQAKDTRNVIINTSNTVCENDFNRNHFEDRYKQNFEGYIVTCSSAH